MAVLLFDVFGTLVDWRSSIARQCETAFGGQFRDQDWFTFADAWRAEYQPAMERVRAGNRDFVPLDVLHEENFIIVSEKFGLSGLSKADHKAATLFWHRLDPWPDVSKGLQLLGKSNLLAPHSNGNVRLLVDLARYGDLSWDAIMGAEVTGHYKPVPQSYLRACAMMGSAPERCIMVAAHNDDLAAAHACGLKTAFIPRPTEHGPDQKIDLTPEQDWTYVSNSLIELSETLGPTRPIQVD